jgi:malate dehydrogenase (oxaloacetate-decarboxylating)(NADP+)
VVRSRPDAESLDDHKLPYIQDAAPAHDLHAAVGAIKPTVLIGLSDEAPPFAFTQQVRAC